SFVSTRNDADWSRPTRCAGWSIRDVLAHLLAAESYHHACLDGTVAEFEQSVAAKGGADLERANAIGIAELSDRAPTQLLAEWRAAHGRHGGRVPRAGDAAAHSPARAEPGPRAG